MNLHECNIHCHTMTPDKMDLLSIEDDQGKWMPFMFDLDIVVAAKQTSEDEEELVYNATTIFTDHGDTYIIDTPYYEFFKLLKAHHESYNGNSSASANSDGEGEIEL